MYSAVHGLLSACRGISMVQVYTGVQQSYLIRSRCGWQVLMTRVTPCCASSRPITILVNDVTITRVHLLWWWLQLLYPSTRAWGFRPNCLYFRLSCKLGHGSFIHCCVGWRVMGRGGGRMGQQLDTCWFILTTCCIVRPSDGLVWPEACCWSSTL